MRKKETEANKRKSKIQKPKMRFKTHKLLATLALGVSMCVSSLFAFSNGQEELVAEAAESAVVYDASTFGSFKNRTKQEVATKYMDAYYSGTTYINSDSKSYYSVQASTKAPYNKGKLTDDTQKVMSAMTDYCRWLTGANPMRVPSSNASSMATSLQAQALDRNFEFNHYISNDSKPADMSNAIWSEGFACDHNILAWNYTPAGAIVGWLNEGYTASSKTWGTLGHRNAILSPGCSEIQYGYCGSIAVGKDMAQKNTHKEAFTAFPAPGYMPKNMVDKRDSSWNVYLDTSKIKVGTAADIAVTVKNLTTSTSYQCTKADNTIQAGTSYVEFVQPTNDSGTSSSSYSDSYSVEITGLTDVATGKKATIRYTVRFFDLSECDTVSPVRSASGFANKVCIPGGYGTDTEYLGKVAKMLPKNIYLTNDQNQKAEITAAREWKLDAGNQCFVNYANEADLPDNMTDQWNRLSRITIPYEEGSFTSGSITLSSPAIKQGGHVEMKVSHAYVYGTTQIKTQVYQFNEMGSNRCFDSDVNANTNQSSYYYHSYDLNDATYNDAAEYIGMYYITSSTSAAYVGEPVSLEVRDYGIVTDVYGALRKLIVYEPYMTEDNLKKVTAAMPSTVTVSVDTGEVVEIPAIGPWKLDMENLCIKNKADLNRLPDDVKDMDDLLKAEITVPIVSGTGAYYSIGVLPAKLMVGEDVTFRLHRYSLNASVSQVYQICENEDGEIEGKLRFDSRTSEELNGDNSGGGYDYYDVSDVQESDSGEYIALFFNPNTTEKTRDAYVSNVPAELTVKTTAEVTGVNGPYTTMYYYYEATNIVADYLKKVAATIPKKAFIRTEFNTYVEVAVTGDWKLDTASRSFVNEIDPSSVPSWLIDSQDLIGTVKIPYTGSYYSGYQNYETNLDVENVDYGETVVLSVERDNANYEYITTYRIAESETGYQAEARLGDKADLNYLAGDSSDLIDKFQIVDVDDEDAGEYISVYTSTASNTTPKLGYVSCNTAKLTVEHDYQPVYTWSDDCGTCTMTMVCTLNDNHKLDPVSMTVTSEVTEEPTCEEKGQTTYTASYTYAGKTYTDEKTLEDIEPIGHKYAPVYNWNTTDETCTMTLLCQNDRTHKQAAVQMDVELMSNKLPTCVEAGLKTYKAVYDTYTDMKEVTVAVDANAHPEGAIVTNCVVEATCVSVGHENASVCSLCQAVVDEGTLIPMDPDAHNEASIYEVEAVEATCTKTGLTAGTRCGDCGKPVVAQEVIPQKEHVFTRKAVMSDALKRAATLDSPAVYYYSCQTCSAVNNSATAATFTSGSKLAQETPSINVSYRTHVQSIGWQPYMSNGQMAGTFGMAKRLEGINIKVESADKNQKVDLGIRYTTHCQTYGWLPWSSNNDMNGTEGEAKRLEAIMIELTGKDKDKYDVYYRVHAQSYGWLDWTANGKPAGTAGKAKRLEGIQILVLKKTENAAVAKREAEKTVQGIKSSTPGAFIAVPGQSPIVNYPATSNTNPVVPGASNVTVAYRTHVQSFGWQGWKFNGQMSGTSGLAKRLEGIEIKLNNKDYTGNIVYTTHIQSYGWQGDEFDSLTWKKNGQMSGTSGQAKRLEAIRIALTGEMAEHYDVYYRVHAQSYGWLGWAKNGEASGTAGYAKRLEGIQIVLVPKGGSVPSLTYGNVAGTTRPPYIKK